MVKLVNLEQVGKLVVDVVLLQCYSMEMMNVIFVGLDKIVMDVVNVVQNCFVVMMDVQSVVDDIGLFMLVVCGLFNFVW